MHKKTWFITTTHLKNQNAIRVVVKLNTTTKSVMAHTPFTFTFALMKIVKLKPQLRKTLTNSTTVIKSFFKIREFQLRIFLIRREGIGYPR